MMDHRVGPGMSVVHFRLVLLVWFTSCAVIESVKQPDSSSVRPAAQNRPHRAGDDEVLNEFGVSLAVLGDLDGDGLADLAVGDPSETVGNAAADRRGSVLVFSSRTGAFLAEAKNDGEGQEFGMRLASVPDTDGDGQPDLLVGCGSTRISNEHGAWLLSGRTLALIRKHMETGPGTNLGESVLGVPDVDGDGRGDYLIGNPGGYRRTVREGCVSLYSGRTGALLWTALGRSATNPIGWSLARYQELDADGAAAILVGASAGDEGLQARAGYVLILSGTTGAVSAEVKSPTNGRNFAYSLFGCSLADIGDCDGDGRHDLLVGAPDWIDGPSNKTAFVCSGKTLEATLSAAKLIEQDDGGPIGEAFGQVVAGLSDLDGDGTRDWAVGDNQGASVSTFSGRTGRVLWRLSMNPWDGNPGAAIVSLPDLDGDGVGDLAVGSASFLGLLNNCRVLIVSGRTGAVLREIIQPSPEERIRLRR